MRYLVAAAALLIANVAHAERFYDAQGRYQGRAEDHGNETRYYDAHGRLVGYTQKHGVEIREYDGGGHFLGSVLKAE